MNTYRISLRVRGKEVFSADCDQFQLPAAEQILCAAIRRVANESERVNYTEACALEITVYGVPK